MRNGRMAWALVCAGVLAATALPRPCLAQAPTIEETGIITPGGMAMRPGSLDSLLGMMPGSSGVTFGTQPGRDDMLLGRIGRRRRGCRRRSRCREARTKGPGQPDHRSASTDSGGTAFPLRHARTAQTRGGRGTARRPDTRSGHRSLGAPKPRPAGQAARDSPGRADVLTASLRANPIFYADSQLVPYGSDSVRRPDGPTQYDVNISHPIDYSHKRLAPHGVCVARARGDGGSVSKTRCGWRFRISTSLMWMCWRRVRRCVTWRRASRDWTRS